MSAQNHSRRIFVGGIASAAIVAVVAGCLGFATGANWGAERARAEFLSRDIGIRFHSAAYSRLSDGCTLAIYLGSFLKDPTTPGVVANLQGSLQASLKPQIDALDIPPFQLQERQVSAYLRSPWLMHKYDAMADEVDDYSVAVVAYESAVQVIANTGPDYASISTARREELMAAFKSLQEAIRRLAPLNGDSPRKWNCVPLN